MEIVFKKETPFEINGIPATTKENLHVEFDFASPEIAAETLAGAKLLGYVESGLPASEGKKAIIWGANGKKVLVDSVVSAEDAKEIKKAVRKKKK